HDDVRGSAGRQEPPDVVGILQALDPAAEVVTKARTPALQTIEANWFSRRGMRFQDMSNESDGARSLECRESHEDRRRIHDQQRTNRYGQRLRRQQATTCRLKNDGRTTSYERDRQHRRAKRQTEIDSR